MKKKIGIDLDITLFKCNSILYFFLNKLNYNKGKKLKQKEIPLDKIYKCNFLNSVVKCLNPNSYSVYCDAVKIINNLSLQGFEIYLVSNRPCIKSVIAMTIETLKRSGVHFDKLILGCNNKIEYIKKEKLDYFIDDLEFVCNDILQNTKAKPLFFKSKLKDKQKRRLRRCINKFSNWNEIGTFFENADEIEPIKPKKFSNEKCLT